MSNEHNSDAEDINQEQDAEMYWTVVFYLAALFASVSIFFLNPVNTNAAVEILLLLFILWTRDNTINWFLRKYNSRIVLVLIEIFLFVLLILERFGYSFPESALTVKIIGGFLICFTMPGVLGILVALFDVIFTNNRNERIDTTQN